MARGVNVVFSRPLQVSQQSHRRMTLHGRPRSRPRLRLESRYASSTSEAAAATKPPARYMKRTVLGTSLAVVLGVGYLYLTDTRASVHRYIVPRMIRWLYPDAED